MQPLTWELCRNLLCIIPLLVGQETTGLHDILDALTKSDLRWKLLRRILLCPFEWPRVQLS